MEQFTEDKINITNITEIIGGFEITEEISNFLNQNFESFRIVKNNNLFIAISFNYFEILCRLRNPLLIERNRELIKNKDIIPTRDYAISQSLDLLLENPDTDILEMIKNHFDHFTTYFKRLMAYFYNINRNKWKFLSMTDRNQLNLILRNNEAVRIYDWLLMLAANVAGISIVVYTIEDQQLKKSQQDPIGFHDRNVSINLLKIDPNAYFLLYSRQDSNRFAKIEASSNKSISISILFFNELSNANPIRNCGICYIEDNTLPSTCGHMYYHFTCISNNTDLACKICSAPLSLYCDSCISCNRKKIICQVCENFHTVCQNCMILNIQSNSRIDSPLYICQEITNSSNCPIIDASQIRFTCQNCRNERHAFDFVPVACFDNHDYLCKACWTGQEPGEICPFNKKRIGVSRRIVDKYLSETCEKCKGQGREFFRERICKQSCRVCTHCQESVQKYSELCAKCDDKLVPKIGPWI